MSLIKGGYFPKCPRVGCFANKDAHCVCLIEAYSETNIECPFFKWQAQAIEERKMYPWTDYSAQALYKGRKKIDDKRDTKYNRIDTDSAAGNSTQSAPE